MAERIPPSEAKRLLDEEGYVYLDVRTAEEFEEEHVPGSYNVPVAFKSEGGMTPNPKFLKTVERHFDKDAKLVVGCRSGGRSHSAVKLLEGAGFTGLADQRAGMGGSSEEPGWSASLPVAKGAEPGKSYADLSKED